MVKLLLGASWSVCIVSPVCFSSVVLVLLWQFPVVFCCCQNISKKKKKRIVLTVSHVRGFYCTAFKACKDLTSCCLKRKLAVWFELANGPSCRRCSLARTKRELCAGKKAALASAGCERTVLRGSNCKWAEGNCKSEACCSDRLLAVVFRLKCLGGFLSWLSCRWLITLSRRAQSRGEGSAAVHHLVRQVRVLPHQ